MHITLLSHTPDPERAIATAARLCYSPIGAAELAEKMTDEEVKKLIKFIVASGHHSTIEHASFTFAIEGISRACTHQLVRHRLASYNQQSQRYVKFDQNLGFIVPPEIEKNPEAKDLFVELQGEIMRTYIQLLELGIPAEDARYVLPNAAESKIIVTMNARELFHFFTLRTCERAQWEIRKMAWKMLNMVRPLCPTVFENAGPYCFRGPCPEGKFKCARPPKKSEMYETAY